MVLSSSVCGSARETASYLTIVTPAQAGVQRWHSSPGRSATQAPYLDSGFRRKDARAVILVVVVIPEPQNKTRLPWRELLPNFTYGGLSGMLRTVVLTGAKLPRGVVQSRMFYIDLYGTWMGS